MTLPSNGKYHFFKEGRKFTDMDDRLLMQAHVNEIAESNRLRRLHLLAIHVINNVPELNGQLEDRAGDGF